MDLENKKKIINILIEEGEELIKKPRGNVYFTNDESANNLINEIDTIPHAFLIACIMDRQVKSEIAWSIPEQIKERIGTFNIEVLEKIDINGAKGLYQNMNPKHRFPNEMASNFYQAIKIICNRYNNNAANIWNDKPSSAEAVLRFLEFRGVGLKIATMAVNILARDFKIEFSDYYSIDISVDTHIKRVFRRIGLVGNDATNEQIIYSARAISPIYPGILDLPIWEIGRNCCKKKKPICNKCLLQKYCLKII